MLRVIATAGEHQPRSRRPSTSGRSSTRSTPRRPRPTLERRPRRHSSSTIFEFTGTDDLTPPELLDLRVPHRQHERARLAGVRQPVQPARPLHLRGRPDGARRRTPSRCAPSDMAETPFESPTDPNPNFEGNVDPTPATLHLDDDGRHDRRRAPGSSPAPRRARRSALPTPTSSSSATTTPRRCSSSTYQCVLDAEPWPVERRTASREPNCDTPFRQVSLLPGEHTSDPRHRPGRQRRPDAGHRTWTVVADAAHDDHVRAGHAQHRGRSPQHERQRGLRLRRRPARLHVRVLARRRRRPHRRRRSVRAVHLAGGLLPPRRRRAQLRGPGDQPRGRDRGAGRPLRVDRRARARPDPPTDGHHHPARPRST